MFAFFNQPYPFITEIGRHIRINVLIGTFIGLFLIVFQPFNTNIWVTEYKIFKLAGFGVIAFLVPTIITLAQQYIYGLEKLEPRWTVKYELCLMVSNLAIITLINLFYGNILDTVSFSLSGYFGFFLVVMSLGVFPIMGNLLFKYNRYQQINKAEAATLSQNLQSYQLPTESSKSEQVTLVAENKKDAISLNINDLLYIESADNYSNVVFLKDGKIQKELLRGALKRFEQQLDLPLVQRCHRSYIVNLQQVIDIKGNAQGYRMTLSHGDVLIPVARNYGAIILEKLNT